MADKKLKNEIGRAGRVEREARLNKIITYSTIAIIALVLVVVIGGAIYAYAIKPNQTLVTVNEETITTKEFQSRVKFIRNQYVNIYTQIFEYLQYFSSAGIDGTDDLMLNYYEQLMSLQSNLDNHEYIGYNVITSMSDELIFMAEAEKRGISISDEELEIGIQANFNYYPNSEEDLIPEDKSQNIEDDLINDQDNADDAESGESTEDQPEVTPEPTVDPYEEYLDNYAFSIAFYEKELNFSEEEYKFYIEVQLVLEKLYDELTKDVVTTSEHFQARHFLVSDQSFADQLIGEYNELLDWYDLEIESLKYGDEILSFGELGWISTYDDPTIFAAVEGIEAGEIIGPIETENGYQIIYVQDWDPEMELSENGLEAKKNALFEEWLLDIREEYEVLFLDDWISRIPTEPDIPFQLKLQ